MSKRPSFQFYPADWQSNVNLRRCTFEERGIWLELICYLHDSEEYGILRWTLEEISTALGCIISKLEILVRKGVLKGTDSASEKVSLSDTFAQRHGPPLHVALIDAQHGPIWYSSRMVRDEYIRKKRADGGCKALEHPNVPKKTVQKDDAKVPEKDTLSGTFACASSSSSSTYIKDKEKDIVHLSKTKTIATPSCFEEFWNVYPIKKNKKKANEIWQRKKLDEKADFIIAHIVNRKERDQQWKDGFIPHATTFLNGERWDDEIKECRNEQSNRNTQSNGVEYPRYKNNSERTFEHLAKLSGFGKRGESFDEFEDYLSDEVPKLVSE